MTGRKLNTTTTNAAQRILGNHFRGLLSARYKKYAAAAQYKSATPRNISAIPVSSSNSFPFDLLLSDWTNAANFHWTSLLSKTAEVRRQAV